LASRKAAQKDPKVWVFLKFCLNTCLLNVAVCVQCCWSLLRPADRTEPVFVPGPAANQVGHLLSLVNLRGCMYVYSTAARQRSANHCHVLYHPRWQIIEMTPDSNGTVVFNATNEPLHVFLEYQRIRVINRSPRSTFCRPKLLQILSPCVLSASLHPHPLLLLTNPCPLAVSPPPDTHGERTGAVSDEGKFSQGFCH
jgi:hypothetical protein